MMLLLHVIGYIAIFFGALWLTWYLGLFGLAIVVVVLIAITPSGGARDNVAKRRRKY